MNVASPRDNSPRAVPRSAALNYSSVHASPWPLVVASFALVLSIAVVVIGTAVGEPIVLLTSPWVELPLPQGSQYFLGWAGYMLTPVTTIAMMVVDRVLQGRGLADPQFIPRPLFGAALKVISAASIILSLWHIVAIAVPIIEWIQGA